MPVGARSLIIENRDTRGKKYPDFSENINRINNFLADKKKIYISKGIGRSAELCHIDTHRNNKAYISYIPSSGDISSGSATISWGLRPIQSKQIPLGYNNTPYTNNCLNSNNKKNV